MPFNEPSIPTSISATIHPKDGASPVISGGASRPSILRLLLPFLAVLAVTSLANHAVAEDEIPRGELIPPPTESDEPRELVLEMMNGRVLVGKFDPVRRVIKTSGAIKAEIYIRNMDVKAWYEAVPESAKAISAPEVKREGSKPIIAADDAAWAAKVPPYRINMLEKNESGEYQKRFTLLGLDASSLESWEVAKRGYDHDNPLVMVDGKEESHWSFGFARNSVKLVLNEPAVVSMVGMKFQGYLFRNSVLKSMQIEVNDGTPVEASEPKCVFRPESTLYITFRQPSEVKSLTLTNLNGGDDTVIGIAQIYFLRDKKLQKMMDGK